MKKREKTLGIVVPFLNEAENLQVLYRRTCAVFDGLEEDVSFVFVDDGSTDGSFQCLEEIRKKDSNVRIVRLSRNFGHQAAVTAGLNHIDADAVVVMDADLQDPPEVIPEMMEKWREGFQVVYGVRCKRKENWAKRASYFLFYRIMERIVDFSFPLDAGDFALIDREIVDLMNQLPEKNRFVRGLRSWVGFRQIGIEYERDSRSAGTPKYSIAKLFKLALDGLVAYSSAPLRLANWIGMGSAVVGFLYFIYIIVSKIFLKTNPPGWTSLAVIVLFLGGVQLIVLGIIGEYISRIFEETKQRPSYIVAERVGWDNE